MTCADLVHKATPKLHWLLYQRHCKTTGFRKLERDVKSYVMYCNRWRNKSFSNLKGAAPLDEFPSYNTGKKDGTIRDKIANFLAGLVTTDYCSIKRSNC